MGGVLKKFVTIATLMATMLFTTSVGAQHYVTPRHHTRHHVKHARHHARHHAKHARYHTRHHVTRRYYTTRRHYATPRHRVIRRYTTPRRYSTQHYSTRRHVTLRHYTRRFQYSELNVVPNFKQFRYWRHVHRFYHQKTHIRQHCRFCTLYDQWLNRGQHIRCGYDPIIHVYKHRH